MVATAGRVRNLLLICGIVAPLLFVGTDILAGMLWEGYSFTSQYVSDLSAIGALTRPLVVPLNLIYNVLMIAFGLAVWGLAGQKLALRVTAGLIVGNAVIALVVNAFFPMHLDETVSTFANTMNVVLLAASLLFILLAIGFGAAAYRNWFRYYSVGTLLTFLALTILGLLRPQIGAGQPTSLVGVQERTIIYGCLLWVLVLAVVLLRAQDIGDAELIAKSITEGTREV